MRPDRIRVGVGVIAMACGLIDHCTETSANLGIGQRERSVLHAAILLLPESRVVPPRAVIECQLASDFPTVLNENAIPMRPQPGMCKLRERDGAGVSKEKAGVSEPAARRVGESLAELRGIGGLNLGEAKLAVGAAGGDGLDAFIQRCRAQLISVISLDPGGAGVERRLG